MVKNLALVACLLLCGCPKGGDLPSPGPAPGVPTAEMQLIVKDLVDISDSELSVFYADVADVIERDSEIIKTTGDVREGNSRSGRLMWQGTSMKGKYPGLADKIDSAIAAAIGTKNVALGPEQRAKAVEVFKAISWAVK